MFYLIWILRGSRETPEFIAFIEFWVQDHKVDTLCEVVGQAESKSWDYDGELKQTLWK